MKDIFRRLRIFFLQRWGYLRKQIDIKDSTLLIAPHPDDEIIGCGGLIQKFVAQGLNIHIVFMTGGEKSHQGCCDIDATTLAKIRRTQAKEINTQFGVKPENLHFLSYPDGGIEEEHEETMRLRELVNKIHPTTIFVPHWGEGWTDHTNTRIIGKKLAKEIDAQVYEYCVWMWYYNVWHLDWKNAYILTMTREEHQNKLVSIEDYTLPCAPCGKPWSGVLPKIFLDAARWNRELYFSTR